jgi:hypothetical protein
MSSVDELKFANKQLRKAVTREWLRQAYLRKQHQLEIRSLHGKLYSLEASMAD